MIKNFLLSACRNTWRNKIFSLINIAGLSIGISASLVIYLIVNYQFSFDKFEKDRQRIFRVVSIMHFPGQEFKLPGVPMPMADAVTREISSVEISIPIRLFSDNPSVAIPGSSIANPAIFKSIPDIIFTNEGYFKLIHYKWLAGSADCLQKPFTVVLSESRAKKYFPKINPAYLIGKTITYNDSIPVTIKGVVKDLDEITEFRFKEFVSMITIPSSGLKGNYNWDEWSSINSASQFFVKLNPGVSSSHVAGQIQALRAKYLKNDYLKTTHFLQPLNDIHFNEDYGNFDQTLANKSTLYGLLLVAAFLLLLACINFINLTTAQGAQRAKEIGIRKTLGSSKKQLILQLLSETFLLTIISTFVSIGLVPELLTIFADYIPAGVSFKGMEQPNVMLFILVLMILVGFFSGFYPALILTRFKPVEVLKNQKSSQSTRKAVLRKSLTVVQFMIAQFFIIATLVVGKQIHYLLNKDLGFKKEGIVIINLPFKDKEDGKKMVLLQNMNSIPEIDQAVLAGQPPSSNGYTFGTMTVNNGKEKIETSVDFKFADANYFALYKMKLLAGRWLNPSDTVREYLINDTYARLLGFQNPSDAVGHFIERGDIKKPIVGVLADFHTQSLHSTIKPLTYASAKNEYSTLHIGLKPQIGAEITWKNALTKIEKSWKGIYPNDDFSYEFFDESIAKFYKAEQDTSTLLAWATLLTIFISCLGLLGLAVYTTNQRTKEIGIRKVLGASINQIVFLLSKDFIKLIAFAFIITAPVAWWGTHKWLQDFAYRTTLDWWVFASAGILMISFALIVLSFRTIRSASVNPVNSLRSE
jgi:putative ABC transport system permease protein